MMKINVKKDDIERFNNSDIGKIKNHYLKRAMITGIICIMISLGWIVVNVYMNVSIYEYIIPFTLLLFGIYFIFNSNRLKLKEVNKYINSLKSSKK